MSANDYLFTIKPMFDTSELDKQIGNLRKQLRGKQTKSGKSIDDLMGKLNIYDDVFTKIYDSVKNIEDILRTVNGKDYDLNGINSGLSRKEELLKKLQEMLGDVDDSDDYEGKSITQKIHSFIGKGGALEKFTGALTVASGTIISTAGAIKEGVEKAIELINTAAKNSNLLNPFSAYGSMSTRDTMARYGMSVTEARGHTIALGLMRLSESDIGRMSAAQRKEYEALMQYYQEGLSRIDPQKLKDYFDELEEFQMATSRFKLDLQNSILKLFAESDAFKRLTGSVEDLFENIIDFMDSDTVKFFFDTFIGFLESLTDFASWFFSLFGGSSTNTTNNNTTNNSSNNVYYIYGSDSRNNRELARDIIQGQQQGAQG